MQHDYRDATLASVAPGRLTAADALANIDNVRRIERIAYLASRSAAHLLGRGQCNNEIRGFDQKPTLTERHEDEFR